MVIEGFLAGSNDDRPIVAEREFGWCGVRSVGSSCSGCGCGAASRLLAAATCSLLARGTIWMSPLARKDKPSPWSTRISARLCRSRCDGRIRDRPFVIRFATA